MASVYIIAVDHRKVRFTLEEALLAVLFELCPENNTTFETMKSLIDASNYPSNTSPVINPIDFDLPSTMGDHCISAKVQFLYARHLLLRIPTKQYLLFE